MQTSTNILNKISGLDIMGFYGGLFQSGGGVVPSFPTDGLFAYWKMENTDDSFGSNILTNNSATTETGKIGSAYNVSTGYLKMQTTTNSIFTSNAYTISTWIYPTSYSDSQPFGKYIISNDESNGGARQFAIGLGSSGSYGPGKFFFESQASGHIYGTSGSTVPLNQWTMFTVTYDGVNIKSYLNGVLNTTTAVTPLPSSSNYITIGRRLYSSYEGIFQGKIDEMSIHSRTLTPEEITLLYNGGNGTTL